MKEQIRSVESSIRWIEEAIDKQKQIAPAYAQPEYVQEIEDKIQAALKTLEDGKKEVVDATRKLNRLEALLNDENEHRKSREKAALELTQENALLRKEVAALEKFKEAAEQQLKTLASRVEKLEKGR